MKLSSEDRKEPPRSSGQGAYARDPDMMEDVGEIHARLRVTRRPPPLLRARQLKFPMFTVKMLTIAQPSDLLGTLSSDTNQPWFILISFPIPGTGSFSTVGIVNNSCTPNVLPLVIVPMFGTPLSPASPLPLFGGPPSQRD
jgi:hypothetical protein